MEEKHCQTCRCMKGLRQIVLYTGMVRALWSVFLWAREKRKHEFTRKEIKHLFVNENDTARFGDWVLFGGLVYKNGKGHWGLNRERCDAFFRGTYAIPMRVLKNPVTNDIIVEERKTIHHVPSLMQFLNEEKEWVSAYKHLPVPTLF